MDITAHFASYRKSVSRTALPGCEEFSRNLPTLRPDTFKTAYDYLTHVLRGADGAISEGHLVKYKGCILNHQKAMIALFEKMVESALPAEINQVDMLNLIEAKGWTWFRYAKHTVDFKVTISEAFKPRVMWVPRYSEEFESIWSREKLATFDAEEMAALFRADDVRLAQKALRTKRPNPGYKIFSHKPDPDDPSDITLEMFPVKSANTPELVRDWTLELFHEN